MQVKLNLISALNNAQSRKNANVAQKPANAGYDTYSFRGMNFLQEVKSSISRNAKTSDETEMFSYMVYLRENVLITSREDKAELFKHLADKYALSKGSSQFKQDLLEHINVLDKEERIEYVNKFLDSFIAKKDAEGAVTLWKNVIAEQALMNNELAQKYIKLAILKQNNNLDVICIKSLNYISDAEEKQESYKFLADRAFEAKDEKNILACLKRLNLLPQGEAKLAYFKKFANYAANSDSSLIKRNLNPEIFFKNEWLEQAETYLNELEPHIKL